MKAVAYSENSQQLPSFESRETAGTIFILGIVLICKPNYDTQLCLCE